MKEVRAIDIDEVLFETIDQILEYHGYRINNQKITKNDITDYHIYKVKKFNINKENGVQWFHGFLQSEEVHKIQPVQWAKEVLEKIQAQGNILIAITWRLEKYSSRTAEALQKHYPGVLSDVIYLNAYGDMNTRKITQETKSHICKKFWATIMVEDDLHYAQELADNGIKVYLLDKPRNQEYKNGMHPNIIKIDERKELLDYEKINYYCRV